MNQTNNTEKKKPKSVYIIVGAIFHIGILSKMCGSDKNEKQSSEGTKDSKQTEQSVEKKIEQNAVQLDFIKKKTDQFRQLIESGATADDIKKQANSLTKSLIKAENNELKDWEGVIIGVDMFKEKNLDIAITIKPKEIVGKKTITKNGKDFTFNCGITIEATQGDSKKYGYKGISRQGELYEKVQQLKEGDEVVFSAKVVDILDNTEATGLNLSTLLEINLTDIRKK